jgi:hypothetical protein
VPVYTPPQPGRDRPEWVVAINRNAWSQSIVIGGRNQSVRPGWLWNGGIARISASDQSRHFDRASLNSGVPPTTDIRNQRGSQQAALRHRRNVAGPAMKVRAKLGLHGFEASRDQFNSWHPSVFELRQAGHTRVAALRAA